MGMRIKRWRRGDVGDIEQIGRVGSVGREVRVRIGRIVQGQVMIG